MEILSGIAIPGGMGHLGEGRTACQTQRLRWIASERTTSGRNSCPFPFRAQKASAPLVVIAARLAVVAAWFIRAARISGGQGRELRRTSRSVARHAVFMGGAYVVTLALTLPLSMLVKR